MMMQFTMARKAWMIASQTLEIIHERVAPEESHWGHNCSDDETWEIQALELYILFFLALTLLRLQAEFRQAGKPTSRFGLSLYPASKFVKNSYQWSLDPGRSRGSKHYYETVQWFLTWGCACHDHWEGLTGLYGNVGILVARLQGERLVDCTIVDDRHMVVLKQSAQCLPLVQFPRWMIGSPILIDVQNAMIPMVNEWMNQDDDVARVPGSMLVSCIRTIRSLLFLASGVGQGQQQNDGRSSKGCVDETIALTDVSFVTAKTLDSSDADGTLVYTGTLSNATFQPHGKGKIEYIKLDKVSWHESDFSNGEMTGTGVSRLCDGRILTGDFYRCRIIRGTITFPDGTTYEGSWMDSLFHGLGRLISPNVHDYEGGFRKGYFHGRGKIIYKTRGNSYVGEFRKNRPHGQGKKLRPGGTVVHDG
jgi:hypothetical protein